MENYYWLQSTIFGTVIGFFMDNFNTGLYTSATTDVLNRFSSFSVKVKATKFVNQLLGLS